MPGVNAARVKKPAPANVTAAGTTGRPHGWRRFEAAASLRLWQGRATFHPTREDHNLRPAPPTPLKET